MRDRQKIYLNGKIIDAPKEHIDQLAPGVIGKPGVFETMLSEKGKVLFLKEHYQRLVKGAMAYQLRVPLSENIFERDIDKIVEANGFKYARVRASLWKEGKKNGFAILATPAKGPSGNDFFKGYRVGVSSLITNRTRVSHIKSLDYGLFRQAYEEAQKSGFQENVLFNSKERLVEATRANVFIVKDNIILTPPVYDGCLNGITRKIVVRIARTLKLPCRIISVSRKGLFAADEIFVTNSIIGLMPVVSLQGQSVSNGDAGPVTVKLNSAYQSIINR